MGPAENSAKPSSITGWAIFMRTSTLSTFGKQENMFHPAINANAQDSFLSTKFQANILHINIYFLHCYLAQSWPFFCWNVAEATWLLFFFCWLEQFRWIHLLLLRALKQGFYIGFRRNFVPLYLWQVCINAGADLASILFCRANLDLQQFSESLQITKLFFGNYAGQEGWRY